MEKEKEARDRLASSVHSAPFSQLSDALVSGAPGNLLQGHRQN